LKSIAKLNVTLSLACPECAEGKHIFGIILSLTTAVSIEGLDRQKV